MKVLLVATNRERSPYPVAPLGALFVAGAARFHALHLAAATFELLTVALVGGLVFFATRRRWHHQWFEAREVAERLRIVAPAWLLGAWPSHLKPAQAAWPSTTPDRAGWPWMTARWINVWPRR